MKKIYVYALFSLFFLLTGCSLFPDGNVKKEDVNVDIEDGKVQGVINDKLKVDAEYIEVDLPTENKNFTCVTRQYDKDISEENAKKISRFLNKTIVSTELSGGEPAVRAIYDFDDGSKYYDGDYIRFNSSDYNDNNYDFFISCKNGNNEYLKVSEELNGYSMDAAREKAVSLLKLFSDITINYTPVESYAISTENVKNYYSGKYPEGHSDVKNYIEWDAEDEVYVFEFEAIFNGIPLCRDSFENNSFYSNSNKVTVTVGRNEIKGMMIEQVYSTISEKNINQDILSMEDALEILSASFKYTSQLNEYIIKDIKLVYIPFASTSAKEKKYNCKLYWAFTMSSTKTVTGGKEENTYDYNTVYIVDTETKEVKYSKR